MKSFLFTLTICIPMCSIAQLVYEIQPDGMSGKDALLWSTDPDVNYGDNGDINITTWTYDGAFGIEHSLLQFDLGKFPESSIIDSAVLSLYYNPLSGHVGHYGDNAAFIYRVTEDWNENTITWNSEPDYTTDDYVEIPASTSTDEDYPDINVTAFVEFWKDNPTENFGMLFKLQDEEIYRSLIFGSSDNTDPLLHPKLTIYYSLPENISDPYGVTNLNVYPNPVADALHISLPVSFSQGSVQIMDLLGNVISTEPVESPSGSEVGIQVGHLCPGIYIVILHDKDNNIIATARFNKIDF